MRRYKDNCGPGTVAPADRDPARYKTSMKEFDTLPAPMRKLLAEAPFDFATHGAALLIEEKGLETALEVAARNTPLYVKDAALQDYGEDHPQAADEPKHQ
jgi:hypothetical protein